jgi:hypothetical protein
MTYLLEVQAPGCQAEQYELKTGVVSVGYGEGAELAVAAPPLLPRHVALEVQSEGVRAHLLAGVDGNMVFEGLQLRETMVPWGAEIFVNGVRLSFLAVERSQRKVHPLLVLALGGALIALGWQGGGAAAEASHGVAAVEPPALTMPVTPCSESDPLLALERGRREELAASAKRERYPFDASEGLRSLERLQIARACFGNAGAAAEAGRVEQASESLQRSLDEDLAAWRLRLERAVQQDRPREALKAITGLDALVSPLGESPYRAWLRDERRRLERKQGG